MASLNPDDLYPKELTSCAPEPVVPARPAPDAPRSDEDKARYTSNLRSAWADCHDTVAGVADRKTLYAKQYDADHRSGLSRLWHGVRGK